MTDSLHSDGLIKFLARRNIIDPDHKLTFVGHVVLTSSVLLFTGVSYGCLLFFGTFWEGEWLHKEVDIPNVVKQVEVFNKQTLKADDRQQIRIVEQLNTINDLKARH